MPKIRRFAALTLAAALLLTSCGPKTAATTMRLVKAEGTVGVADDKGKEVEPREALGLYSGYQVDTRSESYAWIDLDEVKLTKMDQNSDISIQKEDKHLEILVNSGSLFFNVTQPLAEDESMEIRTASMVVGIRGTCGWVEAVDQKESRVYLLEGKVEAKAIESGETVTVSAGEMAQVSGREGYITIFPFTESFVPGFIQEEAEADMMAELPVEGSVVVLTTPVTDQDIRDALYNDNVHTLILRRNDADPQIRFPLGAESMIVPDNKLWYIEEGVQIYGSRSDWIGTFDFASHTLFVESSGVQNYGRNGEEYRIIFAPTSAPEEQKPGPIQPGDTQIIYSAVLPSESIPW